MFQNLQVPMHTSSQDKKPLIQGNTATPQGDRKDDEIKLPLKVRVVTSVTS